MPFIKDHYATCAFAKRRKEEVRTEIYNPIDAPIIKAVDRVVAHLADDIYTHNWGVGNSHHPKSYVGDRSPWRRKNRRRTDRDKRTVEGVERLTDVWVWATDMGPMTDLDIYDDITEHATFDPPFALWWPGCVHLL